MRLLCAADIHLGRRPSRLPEALAAGAADLGPAAAWRRLVDAALELRVDALLLAGDVVDRDDDFFEAYAELRDGVERLAGAGIEVLAVAGNHDVQVLPRLAEAVPQGFTLLGRGGLWEAHVIESDDGTQVRVLGWSFPEASPTVDPLASLPRDRASEVTVGLLHCDRDQTGSSYAPVRSADLAAAPVDAWLLGHVHKPDIAPGPRPMGYLGSLVGTDPGEPGAHGAWLLEVDAGGALELRALSLAPLRWETLEVPVDGLTDAADLPLRIANALDALPDRVGEDGQPAVIGCRLRLTGRSELRPELRRSLAEADPRNLDVALAGGLRAFVHAVHFDVQPAYDIEVLARGADPVGLVARKLLVIRSGDNEGRSALLRAAHEHLAIVPERRYLIDARVAAPDLERVAELLESAALDIIDALLAQAEARP